MLGLQSSLTKSTARKSYDSTNSLRFVPDDDFIRIADHADFNHVTSSVSYFTVSLWFKHDDGSPRENESLMSKYDSGADKREWRISIDSNDKIVVVISDDGDVGSIITNVSTFVVDDTDWHHLYFRYDGSKTEEEQRVFMTVDGTQVLGQDGGASNVGTPSATNYAELYNGIEAGTTGADVVIGGFLNNNDAYSVMFDGRIDEVCYWDGHFYKTDSITAAKYIYNNGNPRDMRYAGGGTAQANTSLIGYWKMGEFYNGGASVPDGTFPTSTTNPMGTTAYSGGAGGYPLIALNYAGGSPKRTGSNLIRNGDFSTAITECAVDEANNGVAGTSGTDWYAGHSSNVGHTVTNDTSVYYNAGRSIKLVTGANDNHCFINQTTDTNLVDGAFYVFEFWWRTSTDTSDSGSESWGRCQFELDQCIEGDAQYGLSGDGNLGTTYSTINKWHRIIQVGKYNAGSNNNEGIQLARNLGNSSNLAKTYWFDNISLWKLTGSHHGVFVSSNVVAYREGVDL